MPYTLAEAAQAAGRGKTTLLRMIRSGRLSAARDPVTGGWMVEPAELHRLYPPARHEAVHDPMMAHRASPLWKPDSRLQTMRFGSATI